MISQSITMPKKVLGWIQWFALNGLNRNLCHGVVKHLKTKVLQKKPFSSLTMPHPTQMLTRYSQMMGRYPAFTYPPNTTSLIQPMDQGVLENIKRCYKGDLLLRLLNEDEVGSMNIAEFSDTEHKGCCFDVCKELGWSGDRNHHQKLEQVVKMSRCIWQGLRVLLMMMLMSTHFWMIWMSLLKRTDWLTADEGDPGYREFSEEEIVSIAREANAGNTRGKWRGDHSSNCFTCNCLPSTTDSPHVSWATSPLHPWVLW